jgi:hypothetical protein
VQKRNLIDEFTDVFDIESLSYFFHRYNLLRLGFVLPLLTLVWSKNFPFLFSVFVLPASKINFLRIACFQLDYHRVKLSYGNEL